MALQGFVAPTGERTATDSLRSSMPRVDSPSSTAFSSEYSVRNSTGGGTCEQSLDKRCRRWPRHAADC